MIWYLFLLMIFAGQELSSVDFYKAADSIWRVSASSNIKVTGESNVNEFECVTLNYKGEDRLIKKDNGFYNLNELIGTISMQVHSFDCESRMMTRDLRETLKADAYPQINITIVSLFIPQNINAKGQLIEGEAEITIAGCTQKVGLNWRVIPESNNKIRLLSSKDFSFTQFGIKPPSKMMGMIQVKDELLVDIDFTLEKLSATN